MKKLNTQKLFDIVFTLLIIVAFAATLYWITVIMKYDLWPGIVLSTIIDGLALVVYLVATEEDLRPYED